MISRSAKQYRISAPLAAKHKPDAYNEVYELFVPSSEKLLSTGEFELLHTLEGLHFFGGSSSMKQCSFEPDCLGCIRIFCTGKVRFQFFSSEVLEPCVKDSKAESFAKACEEWMHNVITTDHKNLPLSARCVVDCTNGPQMVVIPPGYLVVQEALGGQVSCGVRRSFSPTSPHCQKLFNLAVANSFVHKAAMLKAMSQLAK